MGFLPVILMGAYRCTEHFFYFGTPLIGPKLVIVISPRNFGNGVIK